MKLRRLEQCPACGMPGGIEVVRLADDSRQRFLELSKRKYGRLMNGWLAELEVVIVRCGACGHHWYREQPSPQDLARLYEEARPLSDTARDVHPEYEKHMLIEMRRLYRLLRRETEANELTLLDYGSGFGRWVRAAIDAGFVATGYEPSVRRAAGPGDRVPVIHEAERLTGRVFDCINLEQVLEHVPEPLAILERIRDLCHASTVIRISVPNIERPSEAHGVWEEWPFDGRKMHTMAPFEHLHGFTPRSLTAITRRAGFERLPLLAVCRAVPTYATRMALGRMFARLDQTKLFLRPRGRIS